jgi:hypothetical protein
LTLTDASRVAPVRALFDGRTVYKIDKTYIANVSTANPQQRRGVARVVVTALKIVVLIPLIPLIALGVTLKIVALISSSIRKNHQNVIESYKSSSEKDNLILGSDGWVRILGGKESFASKFSALSYSDQEEFFSALLSLTRNPEEFNFFDCDIKFIEKFDYNVAGRALLFMVKKISIKAQATSEYRLLVKNLFSIAPLLKEMNLEGDLRKDGDFLGKNGMDIGKIPNIDWSQVKADSLTTLVEVIEAVPTISEADRLKLFASYWKDYLAKGSDPNLDFPLTSTAPKEFYKVRNIELLIPQCKGLKKVSVPRSFTLEHIETIQKNCPTLREIYIEDSIYLISNAEIDTFFEQNPTIKITGKRPHMAVGAGFDINDHTVKSMESIKKIFDENPLLTIDNKKALFAKLWLNLNSFVFEGKLSMTGSNMDFSNVLTFYVSLEQSDLELFAQQCKGIKKMQTNSLMTSSQITTFLKNLPKPSTLEELQFSDSNLSVKIQVSDLEDFMKACPNIKEINNLPGFSDIPRSGCEALEDFRKKYPAVEVRGYGNGKRVGGKR